MATLMNVLVVEQIAIKDSDEVFVTDILQNDFEKKWSEDVRGVMDTIKTVIDAKGTERPLHCLGEIPTKDGLDDHTFVARLLLERHGITAPDLCTGDGHPYCLRGYDLILETVEGAIAWFPPSHLTLDAITTICGEHFPDLKQHEDYFITYQYPRGRIIATRDPAIRDRLKEKITSAYSAVPAEAKLYKARVRGDGVYIDYRVIATSEGEAIAGMEPTRQYWATMKMGPVSMFDPHPTLEEYVLYQRPRRYASGEH
jgi:hypothetical protein